MADKFGLASFIDAYDILKRALSVKVDYGTRAGLPKLIRTQIESEAIRIF